MKSKAATSSESEPSTPPPRRNPPAPGSLMELARKLSAAQDEGSPEFLDLARAMKVEPRKAYYLAAVGRKLGNVGIPDEELNAIGWTKLQLIADHIDRVDARKLVEAARMPVPSLRQFLAGENPEGKRAVLLYLSDEQYSLLERVILKYGGRRTGAKGLQDKEQALVAALKDLTGSSS